VPRPGKQVNEKGAQLLQQPRAQLPDSLGGSSINEDRIPLPVVKDCNGKAETLTQTPRLSLRLAQLGKKAATEST